MLARWLRLALWRPYELVCRWLPLVPLRATVSAPVDGVRVIRIDNWVTRLITWLGGGYDYTVVYLVGDEVLVDTGFPWSRRALQKSLRELGADRTVRRVVNTHAHEDHVGNNDMVTVLTGANVLAHRRAVPVLRWPVEVRWYRRFMFGPATRSDALALDDGDVVAAGPFCLRVVATPGHTADHMCLFEPEQGWLFAGDLYVDERLDAQLGDVDGPSWIASLTRVIDLGADVLFDGHGLVINGRANVREALVRKRTFLEAIRERTKTESGAASSLSELTKRVFAADGVVDRLSFHEGRLSLLTGADFARSHLVRSFLPDALQAGSNRIASNSQ